MDEYRELPFRVFEIGISDKELVWYETDTHLVARTKQGTVVVYANKAAIQEIQTI